MTSIHENTPPNATVTQEKLVRRRWTKWYDEPLFSQMKKAIACVRKDGNTYQKAGKIHKVPNRTLRRYVAISMEWPDSPFYLGPTGSVIDKVVQEPCSTRQAHNSQAKSKQQRTGSNYSLHQEQYAERIRQQCDESQEEYWQLDLPTGPHAFSFCSNTDENSFNCTHTRKHKPCRKDRNRLSSQAATSTKTPSHKPLKPSRLAFEIDVFELDSCQANMDEKMMVESDDDFDEWKERSCRSYRSRSEDCPMTLDCVLSPNFDAMF